MILTHLSNKGKIKYHRIQIGQIVQKGNLARVQVEIESSVPEFTLPNGKVISQPPKTVKFLETWMFVNDDWYREFYDEMSEKPFSHY